jgi:hypothetical protein
MPQVCSFSYSGVGYCGSKKNGTENRTGTVLLEPEPIFFSFVELEPNRNRIFQCLETKTGNRNRTGTAFFSFLLPGTGPEPRFRFRFRVIFGTAVLYSGVIRILLTGFFRFFFEFLKNLDPCFSLSDM